MSDRAIRVVLRGGLGNQMFQYAFGYSLASKHNLSLEIDESLLQDATLDGVISKTGVSRALALQHLNLDFDVAVDTHQLASGAAAIGSGSPIAQMASRFWDSIAVKGRPVIVERRFGFNRTASWGTSNGATLFGYWQSYRYFSHYSQDISRQFRVEPQSLPRVVSELASNIRDKQGICVNVRRGDFARYPGSRNFHGLLPYSYYETGLRLARERIGHRPAYVFTDDPDWCTRNLRGIKDLEVVEHHVAGPGFTHYLHLMEHCSAFILPNSTFGWWAAWLCYQAPEIVVAPRRWFVDPKINTDDLIPETWERI